VDDRGVHGGIGDVHVVDVGAADPIRRYVHFARSQREPTHGRGTANPNTNREVRPTNPSHERGSIHRAHISHTDHCGTARHPTPHPAYDHPTPVMKRRKSPGLIVNPRVAPRVNVNPVAIAIRSPAHNSRVREPDGSILRSVAPASVLIQVFVAYGVF